jgi:hypothetical protein
VNKELGQVLLSVLLFFPWQYHSTKALYSSWFFYHEHFIILAVNTIIK